MEHVDYDEAEAARRKKDVVEFRTKKRNSTLFTVCASIFEVIVSLILFFGLFILAAYVITRTMGEEAGGPYVFYSAIAILIISIIAGFKIYKAVFRFIIKKYDLEDKLLDNVLYHYKTRKEIKAEMDSGLRR